MGDELLRETPSGLTMAMIGCLPDNIQQAIKSFSIRPGKQHVTFAFPFMADILRRFAPETYVSDVTTTHPNQISQALFFDQSTDVIDGYQTFITLAPASDRLVMPVVLFTLYQRGTTEGILRHFDSLIRIIIDNKTLLTVWKMPIAVVDLSPDVIDLVLDACAQAVVDVQSENLMNTFPGKTLEELVTYVKENMIVPNMRSYHEHFQQNMKEVSSKLRSVEPKRFTDIIDHIRSVGCSLVDFQKADMMMRSPTVDPLIRAFWRLWGHEQVACKVFPSVMAGRSVQRLGALVYSVAPGRLDTASYTSVPVKEGLQSIIKCLKAQDIGNFGAMERIENLKSCCCNVCKSAHTVHLEDRDKTMLDARISPSEHFEVHSAFHRPRPSVKSRQHHTSTPYSDALKAAAIMPAAGRLRLDVASASNLSTLRAHFRRTFLPSTSPFFFHPGYDYNYPLDPAQLHPLVYKPRIITQQLDSGSEK